MDRNATILRLQQLKSAQTTDPRIHCQEAIIDFLNFIGEYDVATEFEAAAKYHGFNQPVINEELFD